MVYLISDGTHTKIGISNNPRKRLAALQTANSKKLRIIEVLPGGRSLEERLHRHFHRKRLEGEWFNLDEDDIAQIRGLKAQFQAPPPASLAKAVAPPQHQLRLSPNVLDDLVSAIPDSDLNPLSTLYHPLLQEPMYLMPGDTTVEQRGVISTLEVASNGEWVTQQRFFEEAGVRQTILHLGEAESLQEELEILLQAAVLDAQYGGRNNKGLTPVLNLLKKGWGLRRLSRNPEWVEMGLDQLGSIQEGARCRRYLPFVNIYDVQLDEGAVEATPKVLLSSIAKAHKRMKHMRIVVPHLDTLPLLEEDHE